MSERPLRTVIDLCDDDSPPGPQPHRKRRRFNGVPEHKVVDLSDEDDEDAMLARRLHTEELAARRSQDLEGDAALARRMQEEERLTQRREGPPAPHFGGVPRSLGGGFPLGGMLPPPMDDLFGDDHGWARGYQPPMPPAYRLGGGFSRAAGVSGGRAAGQLAALSMLNRDFGEADYEMLLQLDEAAGCAPPRWVGLRLGSDTRQGWWDEAGSGGVGG